MLTIVALYRVAARGHLLWVVLLLPVAALCCWQNARQTLAGNLLGWNQGQWFIAKGMASSPVIVQRSSTCLPWVIYLAWVEPPASLRRSALLFCDSLPAGDLRRLRLRLTLQR